MFNCPLSSLPSIGQIKCMVQERELSLLYALVWKCIKSSKYWSFIQLHECNKLAYWKKIERTLKNGMTRRPLERTAPSVYKPVKQVTKRVCLRSWKTIPGAGWAAGVRVQTHKRIQFGQIVKMYLFLEDLLYFHSSSFTVIGDACKLNALYLSFD